MNKQMTPFQALKRIRQETCSATYCPDFDKQECCDIIENALIEKDYLEIRINELFTKYKVNSFMELEIKLKGN